METLTVVMAIKALAGAGSIGVAVWLLSLVGPRVPQFVALSSWGKRVVMFGLSGAIALSAYYLLQLVPDSFWVAIEQPFLILMAIGGAIFGNQLVHRVGPKLNKVADQVEALDESLPASATLRQTVRDVDRIRQAGMIVPDGLLTPSMRGLDLRAGEHEPDQGLPEDVAKRLDQL